MEPTQCPQGVTRDELEMILGPRLEDFNKWMVGQTASICDGRTYHHDQEHTDYCGHAEGEEYTWKCNYTGTGHYEATECAASPHGMVVYRSDLERFMRGLPIYDWLSTRDRRCLDGQATLRDAYEVPGQAGRNRRKYEHHDRGHRRTARW